MTRLLSGLLLATLLSGAAAAAEDVVQYQPSVPTDALTVSTYYNKDVYDKQNNKIGDVNDILLGNDGRVAAVIIGVGGLLGVGEKDVAVPFNALKVADKDGDRYLVMNTTKEALEQAPGYVFDEKKGAWLPATRTNSSATDPSAQDGSKAKKDMSSESPTERPNSDTSSGAAQETSTPPISSTQGGAELIKTVPTDSYAISEFYQQDVYDEQDNKIGNISDVLVNKNGQISAVLVGVGGFLGLGATDVAMPFGALRVKDKDGKRYLVVATTKEALERAPSFAYDRDKRQWLPATKQARAESGFAGVWRVMDSENNPYEITLSADGSAKADRPGEPMTGTWKDEGGAAVINWNTGWITKITKEGDKHKKTAYDKNKPLEGQSSASSDAEKVR